MARVDAVHIKNRVYQQDFSGIDILTSFSKYASDTLITKKQIRFLFSEGRGDLSISNVGNV